MSTNANYNLDKILQDALSGDMALRSSAEDSITHLADENFGLFLLNLSIKISNEEVAKQVRQISATIIKNMISKPKYINECLEVLNSIIKKGMEPNLKIDLLKKLNVNGVIESSLKNQNISIQALENSAEIINNIGNFLIESYETVKDILIHINTSNT